MRRVKRFYSESVKHHAADGIHFPEKLKTLKVWKCRLCPVNNSNFSFQSKNCRDFTFLMINNVATSNFTPILCCAINRVIKYISHKTEELKVWMCESTINNFFLDIHCLLHFTFTDLLIYLKSYSASQQCKRLLCEGHQ